MADRMIPIKKYRLGEPGKVKEPLVLVEEPYQQPGSYPAREARHDARSL